MSDCAGQRNGTCPVNTPAFEILLLLKELERYMAVGQNLSSSIGHY